MCVVSLCTRGALDTWSRGPLNCGVSRQRMARWHLDELRAALDRNGWSIVALEGDDYRVSGVWQLRRSGDSRIVMVDFEGLDDLKTLPLEQSYACRVRGTSNSLYFGRRGKSGSSSRGRWRDELRLFVDTMSLRVRRSTKPQHG